jgi:ribonuclease HII
LLKHDREIGVRWVAGADEAGRGCLAGPLVAAAVVLDMQRLVGPAAAPLGLINDSKKLTEEQRLRLFDVVMSNARSVSVTFVSPTTIDRVGLHVSNMAALTRVLRTLRGPVDIGLVDGFALKEELEFPTQQLIKGDSKSAGIAAASIIAKVSRDNFMRRLDEQMDNRWAFADHVGYATPLHHERIREHGPSIYHRMSFASIAYEDAPEPAAVPALVTV